MGNTTQSGVKVYDEDQVKHLSADSRAKLEQHVLEQIRNSPDIRKMVQDKSKAYLDSLR